MLADALPRSGVLDLSPLLAARLGGEIMMSGVRRSARSDGSALSFTLPLTPSVSFFGVSAGGGLFGGDDILSLLLGSPLATASASAPLSEIH